MISRWLICSSIAGLAFAMPLSGASVTGRANLLDSRDPEVRKKKDFSGVVVWLEPVDRNAAVRPPAKPSRMIQKDKTFTPHVLAIGVGSTVDFPNFDPIFHNAFSNYSGQVFDVGLYPPGANRTVRFNRAGVVRVFCNIHATMSAVIVVLGTPWFATTATSGTFEISTVPAGDYTLRVFHERATQSTLDALSRRVTIGADGLSLPPLTISEGGYLAIPHQNKYGKQYGPAPDDGGVYPATKK